MKFAMTLILQRQIYPDDYCGHPPTSQLFLLCGVQFVVIALLYIIALHHKAIWIYITLHLCFALWVQWQFPSFSPNVLYWITSDSPELLVPEVSPSVESFFWRSSQYQALPPVSSKWWSAIPCPVDLHNHLKLISLRAWNWQEHPRDADILYCSRHISKFKPAKPNLAQKRGTGEYGSPILPAVALGNSLVSLSVPGGFPARAKCQHC